MSNIKKGLWRWDMEGATNGGYRDLRVGSSDLEDGFTEPLQFDRARGRGIVPLVTIYQSPKRPTSKMGLAVLIDQGL